MTDDEKPYDLAVAWVWEHDKDFVSLIASAAAELGVSFFEVRRDNLDSTLERYLDGTLHFRWVLDRASDEDDSFLPFAHHVHRLSSASDAGRSRALNPHDDQRRASDKATMHLELLAGGIDVPYTIILPPVSESNAVVLSPEQRARLGNIFVIKPANTTGGGIGVIRGAKSVEEIVEARKAHRNDKYLIQETVKPAYLGDFRGWFRVLYAFGSVIPCWWDDQTHIYEQLLPSDEAAYALGRMRDIVAKIHGLCNLDFFSTELAYTADQKLVAVDYVNELCDMRLRSKHPDGVPDDIVRRIARRLSEFIIQERHAAEQTA